MAQYGDIWRRIAWRIHAHTRKIVNHSFFQIEMMQANCPVFKINWNYKIAIWRLGEDAAYHLKQPLSITSNVKFIDSFSKMGNKTRG